MNGTLSEYDANCPGYRSLSVTCSDGSISVGSAVVAIDDATVIVGAGPAAAPKFFVVDIGTDDTFKYATNGAAVGNFALQAGNTDPRDIAANADGSML